MKQRIPDEISGEPAERIAEAAQTLIGFVVIAEKVEGAPAGVASMSLSVQMQDGTVEDWTIDIRRTNTTH